jgi:hypothetical protein
MTTQADARAANAVLLYTPLRKEIEDAIREHGASSDEVHAILYRTPLKAQTPVEVDTFLYALVNDAYALSQKIVHAIDGLHYAVKDERRYGRGPATWTLSTEEAFGKAKEIAANETTYIAYRAAEAVQAYRAAVDAKRLALEVQEPLQVEYSRRPWTRAFLVTDGHVHRATTCTTCFPTTRFTWLTSLSGKDEAEIVALAGERACTVCYPTAPTLRDFEKASPLFTEEEAERAKARDQRAAEKAARDAKKIAAGLTADGSEFVCSWREENGRRWDGATRTYVDGPVEHTERFKTEKAAVQWVVQERSWGQEGPRTAEKRPAFDAIYQAVATKHSKSIEEVIAEVDAKVAAKRKRDSRGY